MSRLSELLSPHEEDVASAVSHALARRPKSAIGGAICLALAVAALVWMWPEIQRYIKIKRM